MIHLSQTSTKGYNDVVFDHRNQAYGAYVLRREYPVNVLKSLLIGIAVIASILAIPYLAKLLRHEVINHKKFVPKSDEYVIQDIIPDEPIPDPPKRNDPPPSANNIRFTIPIVSAMIIDSMPTKEDLLNFNPSTFNSRGTGPWEFTGGGGEDPGDVIDLEQKTYDYVTLEQKPEYVGGETAMRQFLSDNLSYPQHAKEITLEGTVYVTFIIDEFGNLTNIKTPRPIGGGLDEEAIRVMQLMPRWKPGRQGGHPVKVKYQFPILFKLN